jgi:hypothetical protein
MNIPKPILAGFAALAVLLIGLNIALVKQDRALASLNKAYEANQHLNLGDAVPTLSGTSVLGGAAEVAYKVGDPKTLLLVFAPSCIQCALNWPAWRKILQNADPSRVRVIGVTLESEGLASEYLAQVGINKAEMVVLPAIKSFISYRLRFTPQTILIDSGGKVEGIWSGSLNPQQISEIEHTVLSSGTSATKQETAKSE